MDRAVLVHVGDDRLWFVEVICEIAGVFRRPEHIGILIRIHGESALGIGSILRGGDFTLVRIEVSDFKCGHIEVAGVGHHHIALILAVFIPLLQGLGLAELKTEFNLALGHVRYRIPCVEIAVVQFVGGFVDLHVLRESFRSYLAPREDYGVCRSAKVHAHHIAVGVAVLGLHIAPDAVGLAVFHGSAGYDLGEFGGFVVRAVLMSVLDGGSVLRAPAKAIAETLVLGVGILNCIGQGS